MPSLPLRLGRLLLLLSASGYCTSCVAALFNRSGGFDSRPLSVQTVSLFNQRLPSRLAKASWKGDWIFRRDRLEMIDQELKNNKPDVILLQESLSKIGSTAESDKNILMAGALTDYDWREQQVAQYADTQEVESIAIAIGQQAKIAQSADERRDTWAMGNGGYMMATTLDYGDQPVAIFNVQMPPSADSGNVWYTFVQERVHDLMRKQKICPKRLIIGGYLPGDDASRRFVEFVRDLQIKDASTGFCQIASRCYTSTPTNDAFMATIGDESPTRNDRIFVHQSAYVYSSVRDFEESDSNNRYVRGFGINKLWPTQRFGWLAQIRLARCGADELEAP